MYCEKTVGSSCCFYFVNAVRVSPASGESLGIRTHDPHTRGRAVV